MFSQNTFDFCIAKNTIDHSIDPLLCIKFMIKVTKSDRIIVIQHMTNEGERENYQGLHQWNFFPQDECLKISNKDGQLINITSEISSLAETVDLTPPKNETVRLVLRKL